jgi:hypothetical protein
MSLLPSTDASPSSAAGAGPRGSPFGNGGLSTHHFHSVLRELIREHPLHIRYQSGGSIFVVGGECQSFRTALFDYSFPLLATLATPLSVCPPSPSLCPLLSWCVCMCVQMLCVRGRTCMYENFGTNPTWTNSLVKLQSVV